MKTKSNKEVIQNFFNNYTAAQIETLFWNMFIALQYSNDFDNWQPADKTQAANLYKDITGLINNLELSNLKTTLS